MAALKDACDRGVVIVAISQCAKGSVSAAYETGRNLLLVGVVSGGDMTPEVRAIPYVLMYFAHLRFAVCSHKARLLTRKA